MLTNPFFDRLQGHQAIRETIHSLAQGGRTPHALLFVGPEGVGKRLLAYGLAAELLQKYGANPQSVYTLLKTGGHPDLHPVERDEEKKDISVETIRGLRSSLQLQPFLGSASVAIIDNAHLMSIAASNALLLTLEEPAAGRFLLLITHAPQKLPETIVSRCQTVHIGQLNEQQIASILKSLLPKQMSEATLAPLLSLTTDSLAPLGLGEMVEKRTLTLRSETEAWKHLSKLVERCKHLEDAFERAFSGEPELAGDSLSLASLMSEEKGDDLPWLLLRAVARRALRRASSPHATAAADRLLQALEAERLVRERNASPQLQLSSLFLSAGKGLSGST